MPTAPRATGRGVGPRPRTRDINSAVGGLVFARNLTGVDFEFSPSIGLIAGRIDKLGIDIRSFREPLTRAVVEVMIPSFKANFAAQGRPESWEPLAPYTVDKRGATGPILFRKGTLMRAATSQAIWEISKVGAVITKLPSRAWYGAVHQAGLGGFSKHMNAAKKELGEGARPRQITMRAFEMMDEAGGGQKGAAAIPARPFIMFQEEDEYAVQEVFFDWLDNRVRLHWGSDA